MSALKLRLIVTAIAVLSGTTYASDADENTDEVVIQDPSNDENPYWYPS